MSFPRTAKRVYSVRQKTWEKQRRRERKKCDLNERRPARVRTDEGIFSGTSGSLWSPASIFKPVTKVPRAICGRVAPKRSVIIQSIYLSGSPGFPWKKKNPTCMSKHGVLWAQRWCGNLLKLTGISAHFYIFVCCWFRPRRCHYNRHWRRVGVCVCVCVAWWPSMTP